ncbi:hypothetical protein LGV83_07945 [Enterococcus durans]|nr:hypothetical protein [Enterococcus lactis]MCA6771468.1 hypothetical protein [Enterococcus faecium]MCG3447938.1 hypothetical protein [Enterococcus durans]MCA6736418.1 hypothetical protein [Enterococcus lactis]MCA6752005.1 hypothetical protein [Enterococcus lactis]
MDNSRQTNDFWSSSYYCHHF